MEGDAENILLPVIARLVGRNFEQYGVSVVNVGGVGLSRYGRIFMREKPETTGEVRIPVACITDMDVMPDCAPAILGKIQSDDIIPPITGSKRRWRIKSDFNASELDEKRLHIRNKANEQCVRTFVANEWTLEFDLAYFGLAREVYIAIALAAADDKINDKKAKLSEVADAAKKAYGELVARNLPKEEFCTLIYEPLEGSNAISKPKTAQYLSEILLGSVESARLTFESLRALLPPYLVEAIVHVTEPFIQAAESETQATVP